MTATEPPASPKLPALDRRSLLKAGLLGSGMLAAPLSASQPGRGFTHGVASGEPGPDRVLLWTRFQADQDTPLEFEVSDSVDFTRKIAGGSIAARAENDWCCKTLAEGLEPAQSYYFRFIAPDGSISDIGRTRTLPEGPADRFRMAVFSCANIGFGWFNAYAHAAADGNFDCVLHLGDYFYEYAPGTYPSTDETVSGRSVWPSHELVALADYRERYAAYRQDPDLRRRPRKRQ